MPENETPIPENIFYPLVSCIMPTAGRPQYVAQSVAYFLAQDYPAKELIIIYTKPADLPAIHFRRCWSYFLTNNASGHRR